MPRFYCDYCDIHLTHDSANVRRDHNNGWKHRMHVQNYYTELDGVKVQQIINNITKAYVYAGLGGFPELPSAQGGPAPATTTTRISGPPGGFNPALISHLPPPPGFKPPAGMGMPLFPPPAGFAFPGMPPGMPMMPGMPMPPGMPMMSSNRN